MLDSSSRVFAPGTALLCLAAAVCAPELPPLRDFFSSPSFPVPVLALEFGLSTWVQPFHSASPRPSSVPGANTLLTHVLLLSFRFPRRYASFGAMAVGTNSLARGFNRQCTANAIGCAISWSQHAWTPYRLITSTVWVHSGRGAVGAWVYVRLLYCSS